MSEETGIAEDGQEPSMEDILASIRRILSENDEAKIAAVEAELHPEGVPVSNGDEQRDSNKEAAEEADSEPGAFLDDVTNADPSSTSDPTVGSNLASETGSEEPISMNKQDPASIPPVMGEILDLTPEMIASEIISEPTAQTSTDVLSELAAAILDRRDMAVDASSQDMTLEGIVREMLKPILREWLDRNLPYLIERLVKREIDLMVNRAEKLEE